MSNPHRALLDGFESGARFVVYGEEDVIVSNDVLHYFEWADRHFWKRKGVLVVSAVQRWWEPGPDEDEHTVQTRGIFAPTAIGMTCSACSVGASPQR